MIPLYVMLAFLAVAVAKPHTPIVDILVDKNLPSTVESYSFDTIHNTAPINDISLPESYIKHKLNSKEPIATPYGHHFFPGLIGQPFTHHGYFSYLPWLAIGQTLASAVAPAVPAAPAAPPPSTSTSAPAQQSAPAVPFVPIAAQILGELFWMPLENLLINVQQAFFQPPKGEKTE